MPQNTNLAYQQWSRYAYARDNGHQAYVEKADTCEAFYRGDQWSAQDRAFLAEVQRPALTLNIVLPTISNVQGEQIQNRTDISFRPKDGAPSEIADALAKVFKHVSETNQLDWKRSDMFTDGMITSRGFVDMRLSFDDSMRGTIKIDKLNPKNVIVDPDADDYDPDTWNEVFVTKWLTIDEIAVLYGKADAAELKGRGTSEFPYGYDSIDRARDRFGERFNVAYGVPMDDSTVMRNLRVLERQYRSLKTAKFFVDTKTGDMREIPEAWERNRVSHVAQQFGLGVTKKQVRKIRWTVTCDNVVLHDEDSPFQHFTVIPFFPHFRHGHTVGMVEGLLDPQDLLNKATSQELHVVNTTANSGWKVKTGSLINMSISDLEAEGSKTGVVLELDDIGNAEKITANNIPQGLDRLAYKAEEMIKQISGVGDSQQGLDRADVAAKAIQQKRQAGSTNLVKPFDSLARTDFIIARNALDIIQEFYTEERILTITHDRITGETEDVPINQATPEGTIINDLTLGTYQVVVSSIPIRETLEDSQFEQAVNLKELGIAIPDSVIIGASRLQHKQDILKQMQSASQTPEAQQQQQLALRGQAADVEKTEAETKKITADAGLKVASAGKTAVAAHKDAITPPEVAGGDPQLEREKAEHDMQLDREKLEHEKMINEQKLQIERDKSTNDMALKQKQQEDASALARQNAARDRLATKPAGSPKEKAHG